MVKQKIAVCIVSFLLFILAACSPSTVKGDPSSAVESNGHNQSAYTSEVEDDETIDETEYYKIVRSGFMYYYYIFDENHDVVKSDGPLNRQPKISIVDDHLMRFTLQAGTGLGTQWGYFYDIEKNLFSNVFHSIHDQREGKVVYGIEKVMVSDIFDKAKYYREISSFKEPFSEVVEPIIMAEFIDDGRGVKVTYFTGADYLEVTEVVDLT